MTNPVGIKKFRETLNLVPAPIDTYVSESVDTRGMEDIKVRTIVTDDATGTATTAIQGRHSTRDPWFVMDGGSAIGGGSEENFPTTTLAPGTTFPRYIRTSTQVLTAELDQVLVGVEHTLPHQSRQVDHKSRS